MNIKNLPNQNPDGSPKLTYREAIERYKAGTLDSANKEILDRHIKMSAEAIAQMTKVATVNIANLVAPAIQAQMVELSTDLWKPILSATASAVESFLEEHKSFLNSITASVSTLQESFSRLSEPMQEALLILGEHGWYFDMEMPFEGIWELRDGFSSGDVQDADEALSDYFGERLDDIEASIVKKFPKRAKIITSAIGAHRRAEYELSVPVLLTQVDGIIKDVINHELFRTSKGRPQTAYYVEALKPDAFTAAILSPLTTALPINRPERDRPPDFTGLNRHMVLHGESLDYGTRINSFKVVSLLNYVSHALADNLEGTP